MNNMSRPSLFDLRKQASFYIKEKIKTARLALTDVTPVQITTEEATNANPWAPNTQTLGLISRAAFEVDDYWRIVDILHTKLSKFHRKNWRASYNALIVLEYLLTHGPERVANEFQREISIINDMRVFQHVDEKGFNWGLAVRKKSEGVLKLLENGSLLKEERANARKLTREIKGFGSYTEKSTSLFDETSTAFGRSHSQFNEHGNDDNHREKNGYNQPIVPFLDDNVQASKSESIKRVFKENMAPRNGAISKGGFHAWSTKVEDENSLLCGNVNDQNNGGMSSMSIDEDHPFNGVEKHSRVSLLAAAIED